MEDAVAVPKLSYLFFNAVGAVSVSKLEIPMAH